MGFLRDKESQALLQIGEMQRPLHGEAICERLKSSPNCTALNEKLVYLPLDPHEEHALIAVHMLIQMDDIAAVILDELGDAGDQTWAVWGMNKECGCCLAHPDWVGEEWILICRLDGQPAKKVLEGGLEPPPNLLD